MNHSAEHQITHGIDWKCYADHDIILYRPGFIYFFKEKLPRKDCVVKSPQIIAFIPHVMQA